MYRYFLVHDDHMPKLEDNYGNVHWFHLKSLGNAGKGWNALVLHDTHIQPHPEWKPFPKVVDAKTPISAKVDHRLLADTGITGAHTALEAADRLGELFPPFIHP